MDRTPSDIWIAGIHIVNVLTILLVLFLVVIPMTNAR